MRRLRRVAAAFGRPPSIPLNPGRKHHNRSVAVLTGGPDRGPGATVLAGSTKPRSKGVRLPAGNCPYRAADLLASAGFLPYHYCWYVLRTNAMHR